MSGGGQNSTVSNSAPPPQFTSAYSQLLDRGTQVANAPLQQYQGQQVAGFSPDQEKAFGAINNEQGTAQPYIDKAQTHFDAATSPLWGNLPQFSQSGIAGYMPTGVDSYSDLGKYQSPYTQSVVDATQAQFDNQNRQAQLGLQSNEVSKGAWGGDRTGVAAANLKNQEDLAQAPVIAGLRDAGFKNAQAALYQQQGLGLQKYQVGQNEFNQQQQAHLGADEANAWLHSQAGFGTAALGTQSQNSRLTDASTLMQSGGLQQALEQEKLNVPYYEFQQQQAYPFQTTNFLSGLASGLGSASGGTGTSTATSNPSLLSTAVGLGTTGLALNKLGAFDDFGSWFNSSGGGDFLNAGGDGYFGGAARGGAIARRARGGIAAVNDNDFFEPQRMTGTGGLRAYDGGGDIVADGSPAADDPMWQMRPTARPSLPTDTAAGIAAVAPTGAPGGLAGASSHRYVPDYTPPVGTDRAASAAGIRKDAAPMALLTAGLGILGTGNIGKGALEGVKYYQGQQKDAEGIDEKAAEAADTGNYRSADLRLQGQRFSDAADEAAARLKQGDNQFQQTNAREAARDAAQAKYQQGMLRIQAQTRADAEAGKWTLIGTDPLTQKPILMNDRTGKQKMGDDPLGAKPGSGSGMGGREAVYFDRISSAGNMAAKSMANIMELPFGTNRGLFGGRSQGTSLVAALNEDLANKLTDTEAQGYNVMMAGVNRNLGAIETTGLAVPGSMTHSMDAMVVKPGDDGTTILRKMAEMRQIVEEGLVPQLSKPNLSAPQKQLVRDIITKVTTAIPFTQHDVTEMMKSKNPHTTIMDYAKADGLGDGEGGGGNTGGRGGHALVAPAMPSGVPAGSQFSPSRGQWRDPAGKLYTSSGQPIP